jgi:hypothetical protein
MSLTGSHSFKFLIFSGTFPMESGELTPTCRGSFFILFILKSFMLTGIKLNLHDSNHFPV